MVKLVSRAAFTLLLAACLASAQSSNQKGLSAYSHCTFSDGLQIVQTDMLPPGITSRPVQTASGDQQVDLEAGMRIMFAYPNTDFYANVKAERLPAAKYPELKKILMNNFDYMAKGNIVNTAVQSPMNGFEVHGLDREKLEGGVLGVYLLFDDSAHTITTIYLLNQEPQNRQFQTMDEYRKLRNQFLGAYTDCIHNNLTRPQ